MELSQLMRIDCNEGIDRCVHEFLRTVIIRTNFIPAIRYHLGWRGLKEVVEASPAWTMKINGYRGIFGIMLGETHRKAGIIEGRYRINYFPDPDEELIEKFSVSAGMRAHQENYLEDIRRYTLHDDLMMLFNVGLLMVRIDADGRWASLEAESMTQLRMRNMQGLRLEGEQGEREIVAPGELEQDLPAWEITRALFDTLAGSLSFLLQEEPTRVLLYSHEGMETVLGTDGSVEFADDPENSRQALQITWGTHAPGSGGKGLAASWRGDGEKIEPEAIWWRAASLRDGSSLDTQALGVDNRPEFIVLSGFLGAGKTTFLNNFVEYQQQFNRFVAIIQNEIGDESLDTKLLENDFAVLELDEGCVCCTLVGNLKSGIAQIMDQFHPDYIILETTGVANPNNLLDELIEVEELVRFDSVTVLVDAMNIEKTLDEYSVAVDQLNAADIIVLNKTEELNDDEINRLKELLHTHNPDAPVVAARYGDVNPSLLYGEGRDLTPHLTTDEEQHHDHEHHHHTHDMDGLESITLLIEQVLTKDGLVQALENLPGSVFRVKGLVELRDEGGALVQFVSGRYEIERHEGNIQKPFLTVIGKNIRESFDGDAFIAACTAEIVPHISTGKVDAFNDA